MKYEKYNKFIIVFAGSIKEFHTYIQRLITKKWVYKYDFINSEQAMIGTTEGNILLYKYIGRKESLLGINIDKKTEVVTVGTWFEKHWIQQELKKLQYNHENLKFKSANIDTNIKL